MEIISSLAERGLRGLQSAEEVLLAVFVGLLLHVVVVAVARRYLKGDRWKLSEHFVRRLRRTSRPLFPLLAVQATLAASAQSGGGQSDILRHTLSLAVIAASAQFLVALVCGLEDHVRRRHRMDVADNYHARRVHTQVTVLRRASVTFIILVAVALALMTFPRVRQLGASLLASAGLAGLVIGLAAKPIVENLIAGLQIALTQSINIDDVVIIDGEWGWIEEIRTTYVVVRIWDQRRLVVPLAKFIQEPFQNWTRRTAELLGAVTLHVDYTAPVEAIRDELQQIVRGSKDWDGRVCNLQVTEATEHTMQLRALVSAASSPAAWDLRVYVREKLIEFLQREHPQCLPRTRFALTPESPQTHASLSPSDDEPAGNSQPNGDPQQPPDARKAA